jgi:alginate O-acetyltransferase complex protein AlgI
MAPPNVASLTAEQLRALPADEVARLPGDQVAVALKKLDEARWAAEPWYFRTLHEYLPDPFFQTQGFVAFTLAVLVVYWLTPRRWNTVRVCWLVLASFHFYAAWNAGLAFLVTATATLDYLLARLMDRIDHRPLRRAVMFVSVGGNLGVLAYFKYRGFFLNELHDALARLGADPTWNKLSPLDVLIPFGISFYTFEAVSYAVDVFQRKVRAERSLPHFLLFILFFPHLVAGPIVRAGDFLPQARRPKRWNWVRVQVAVQFLLLGLFKKFAIADRMAIFTDGIAGNPGPLLSPETHTSASIWLAVLAYAVRIYADFSGYSDMAVGTAHLFGYRLTQNFDMPYLAANVSEFWRRWHVSLSTWLRDYLFIPLGGSRCGPLRTNINLMLTMLLGGLWHGASWGYVVWGALHGALLVLHRQFRFWAEARPGVKSALDSPPGHAARVAVTFFCVMLCWVFFRPDLGPALVMLKKMVVIDTAGAGLPLHNRSLWYTVLVVLAAHLLVAAGIWRWAWRRTPPEVAGVCYALLFTLSLVLAPEQQQAFIYFTF